MNDAEVWLVECIADDADITCVRILEHHGTLGSPLGDELAPDVELTVQPMPRERRNRTLKGRQWGDP